MSWAEVFKINSDMSTSLDELIKSEFSKLLSGKFLIPSNTEILELSNDGKTEEGNVVSSFTPKINGKVRIRASITPADRAFSRMIIRENGAEIERLGGTEDEEFKIDLTVSAGKKYDFLLQYGLVYELYVCATVVDASAFDYTIGG